MRVPPPSGRVPEQGPERFLVATETCGGGTPDLSSILEVLGYVGIYGCKGYVGGPPGCSRGRGARPRGVGSPPPSWAARDSPDVHSKSIRLLSFQK